MTTFPERSHFGEGHYFLLERERKKERERASNIGPTKSRAENLVDHLGKCFKSEGEKRR